MLIKVRKLHVDILNARCERGRLEDYQED